MVMPSIRMKSSLGHRSVMCLPLRLTVPSGAQGAHLCGLALLHMLGILRDAATVIAEMEMLHLADPFGFLDERAVALASEGVE